MTSLRIKIYLTIILITAVFAGRYAAATTIVAQDGVGATASKAVTPGPILDDFSSAAPVNTWSCQTGTFVSQAGTPPVDNATCAASYTSNPSIAYSGYSLALTYNVTSSGSYAGYFSNMGSQSLTSPTAYTAVSFWVKGAAGGEFFKIQLKNTSTTAYIDNNAPATAYYRNSAAVYITDYLTGGVTTGWQKVTIPFDAFANLDQFSSMKELVIVFEGDQSKANGITVPQGTIYIDNIQFETAAVTSVKVSSFGHKLGVCALGGDIGNFDPIGNTYPTNPSAAYSFSTVANSAPYSMLSQYTVNPGWAGHDFIFGGGNTDDSIATVAHPEKMGWIAVAHNFSNFNYLKFSVRALDSTHNPVVLRIELVDNSGTRYVRKTSVTTDWAEWSIGIGALNNEFSGLDRASIKQVNIVYEDWVIAGFNGNKVGSIYIDDIRFEQ